MLFNLDVRVQEEERLNFISVLGIHVSPQQVGLADLRWRDPIYYHPSSKKKFFGQDTRKDSPDIFDKMMTGASKTLREKVIPWTSQGPAKEDKKQRTGEGVS